MKEEFVIRKAEPKDMAELILLCEAHAAFEKCAYEPKGKATQLAEHLFAEQPSLHCLLLEQEGEVLGYTTFAKQFSTWDAGFYLYLDCIYLKEKSRGKGLGYQLMKAVQAFAKANDCKEIQWQTPDFNEEAIVFYQKLGATSKSKERFFWEL